MARHQTAGELLFNRVQAASTGVQNRYWEDLSRSVKAAYDRDAKRIADAYNKAHPPKPPKHDG